MTSLFSFINAQLLEINLFSFIAQYDDEGYPLEDDDWNDEIETEEDFEDDFVDDGVSFDEDDEKEWE